MSDFSLLFFYFYFWRVFLSTLFWEIVIRNFNNRFFFSFFDFIKIFIDFGKEKKIGPPREADPFKKENY